MIHYIKTNSQNNDFQQLVGELDAYLRICDGEEHIFYAQLNKTDLIKHVIVAYELAEPVGCGAIREYSEDTMEIKRMYVKESKRQRGIASGILKELEYWALELTHNRCLLETGKRQPEAIQFYKNNGYQPVPNFGNYKNVENSVCFEKKLQPGLSSGTRAGRSNQNP